jgi:hypothetical protein
MHLSAYEGQIFGRHEQPPDPSPCALGIPVHFGDQIVDETQLVGTLRDRCAGRNERPSYGGERLTFTPVQAHG